MNSKRIIIFKDHAVIRMLERGIAKNEVLEVIEYGEIIEHYPDDYPYPSCLMFKFVNYRPIHIVVADNLSESQKIVVTVYYPDSAIFGQNFKSRKKA